MKLVMLRLQNSVKTVFEGKWVNIGGKPLYVRVINSYDDYYVYSEPIIFEVQ